MTWQGAGSRWAAGCREQGPKAGGAGHPSGPEDLALTQVVALEAQAGVAGVEMSVPCVILSCKGGFA